MSLQMAFDFDVAVPVPAPAARRGAARGSMAHHAGASAEAQVAADYAARGHPLLARRWRRACGEIDLVFADGDGVVFVEVKKSRSFDRALALLSRRQIGRLWRAAEEYLGGMPRGALTDARFDVALVDGVGAIRVIENAFAG